MSVDHHGAPAFARSMHGLGALMITLSALSPTLGVFVVGSDVIRQAGTGIILCFAAAVLVGVAMASVFAELTSAFPEAGADYTFAGRTLGPAVAFGILGLNIVAYPIAMALTGLGAGTYIEVIAPGLPPVPVALALVAVATGIAALDLRTNALITGTFLALEVLSLVTVAVLGFAHPQRGLATVVHPVMLGAGGGLGALPLAVFGTAAAGALYAFNGYQSVVSIGEELHDAPRRVARVIFGALGIAAVLQIVPLLAVIIGAPDLAGLMRSRAPLSAFVAMVGPAWLAPVISLSVAIAIFNTMIAVALMAGRFLFSTGRDGVWPAPVARLVTQLHPRFGAPSLATLLIGGAGLICCIVPLTLLITLLGSGTVVFYSVACLGVMRGRATGTTAHAGFRMPLYPLAPLAALAALAFVVVTSLGDATGRRGLGVTCGTMLVCALYYRFVVRRHGRWALRGPTLVPAPAPVAMPPAG